MTVKELQKLLKTCRPDDDLSLDTYKGKVRLMVLTTVGTDTETCDGETYTVNYYGWKSLMEEEEMA